MLEDREGVLDLEGIARQNLRRIRRNLTTPMLYEEIIKNREGQLAHLGPIVVRTGSLTERSFEDRFIVKDSACDEKVWWSGKNKPLSEKLFNTLFNRLQAYMRNRDIYVQDCYAGADPEFRLSIRIATETAWHSLFARNMFIQIHDPDELEAFKPDFTVVHIPGFRAIPNADGTHSSAFIIVNMSQKVVFIGGTTYAGEIKQAVFTITDFLIPQEKALSVRCATNVGPAGDAAIFIGRQGSGKTSLSTDPDRALMGDDHHGWTDEGLFNYEWGSYARGLDLSNDDEPLIYECTRRFGTILENVAIDPHTGRLDLIDAGLTENTRAAYPISHIPGSVRDGRCDHPRNAFFLTCDPYGVLPPIARVTPEQAAFALLSSYTPESAEADADVRKARVLHSACFGASPLVMRPQDYARLFMEKIAKHHVQCWLMNTGWSGDPKGRGARVKLEHSRALVHAAVSGRLDDVEYEADPIMLFQIPMSCPGVPQEILNPRTAAADEGEYEVRANRLASDFIQDFIHFKDDMPESVLEMLSRVVLLEDSLDIMGQFKFSI